MGKNSVTLKFMTIAPSAHFFSPVILALLLALSLPAQVEASGLEHHTEKLRLMEAPEIRKIVLKKFEEAQQVRARTRAQSQEDSLAVQESGFVEIEQLMAEVLKITWARPDHDGFRREMTELVQVELSPTDSFANVVAIVAGHSAGALKNPRGLALKEQETHYMILRNLLAEVRPYLKNNEALKRVVEMVRDRGIRLSKELLSHLELSSMQKGQSPSQLAKQILKDL